LHLFSSFFQIFIYTFIIYIYFLLRYKLGHTEYLIKLIIYAASCTLSLMKWLTLSTGFQYDVFIIRKWLTFWVHLIHLGFHWSRRDEPTRAVWCHRSQFVTQAAK